MMAITDPLAGTPPARLFPTCRGRRPCPAVAVLRASRVKGRRVHRCPKRHGPLDPAAFYLQTGRFKGSAGRGHDRHVGPQGQQPMPVLVGEGHAPLWQYFSRLLLAILGSA